MSERKNKRTAKRPLQPTAFPQEDSRFTVAIVGGGASGIAAACALAASAQRAHVDVRVVLLEKGRRIGASILRSGNGRCNFSHANMDAAVFEQAAFVQSALEALETSFLPCEDEASVRESVEQGSTLFAPAIATNAVLRWFTGLGLVWGEAPASEGLLYPSSNKATSVLEVLQVELDRCGVEQHVSLTVVDITKEGDRFSMMLQDSIDASRRVSFAADAVVFAAGGRAILETRSFNVFDRIAQAPCSPVLGPLQTETQFLVGLDGVRARARVRCDERSFSEVGEVLFRPYGISGIVVFNASRFVGAGDTISLDLAPEFTPSQLRELLFARSRMLARRFSGAPTYAQLLQGFFLPELAQALITFATARFPIDGIAAEEMVSSVGIERLAACIESFDLLVQGRGDEKQCQVMRGGVQVDEVDPSTMGVHKMPGLYVTGEALDVDGPCGGYNLHWAWASGLLAGTAIARSVESASLSNVRSAVGSDA